MKTPLTKGSGSAVSSSKKKQSSLTRKAHQFSSLKKKKGGGGTNLFNKIFCSPSSHTNQTLSPSATVANDCENRRPIVSSRRSSLFRVGCFSQNFLNYRYHTFSGSICCAETNDCSDSERAIDCGRISGWLSMLCNFIPHALAVSSKPKFYDVSAQLA